MVQGFKNACEQFSDPFETLLLLPQFPFINSEEGLLLETVTLLQHESEKFLFQSFELGHFGSR